RLEALPAQLLTHHGLDLGVRVVDDLLLALAQVLPAGQRLLHHWAHGLIHLRHGGVDQVAHLHERQQLAHRLLGRGRILRQRRQRQQQEQGKQRNSHAPHPSWPVPAGQILLRSALWHRRAGASHRGIRQRGVAICYNCCTGICSSVSYSATLSANSSGGSV